MKKLRIIHTNDIHSSFDKLTKIATIIKENKTPESILLDAGDFNDFSSILTFGTNGYAGLKILNYLGYSCLTIGNNEGFQKESIIKKMSEYNLVDILSCNLLKINQDSIDGVKPYVIKKVNNIKLLIIGVSPYQPSYNEYYNCYNLKAIEPFEIIRKIIKDNKSKYDYVILLSHLGLKADIMMSQSIKEIDVIISGHSHHCIDCVKVNNLYIHQSGVRGSHVGVLDFKIVDNRLVCETHKNIEITDEIVDDTQTMDTVKRQSKTAFDNLNIIVANAKENLYFSRSKECNFTNLIADYLKNKYECDFSLINSGVTAKNITKGNVTLMDVIEICNSPLLVSSIEIKGKNILNAINKSSDKLVCRDGKRKIGFRGAFLGKLHVSYNCKINNNNELFVDNQLLDKEKYYRIITVDLLSRGEGYKSLAKNKNGKLIGETIKEVIINALNDEKSYTNINKKRWEE